MRKTKPQSTQRIAESTEEKEAQRKLIARACHCESCASQDVTIPMGSIKKYED